MSKSITYLDYLNLVEAEEFEMDGVKADQNGLRRDDRYDNETLRSLTPEERKALKGGPAEWPLPLKPEDYFLRFPCTLEELQRALGAYADAINEDIAAEYSDATAVPLAETSQPSAEGSDGRALDTKRARDILRRQFSRADHIAWALGLLADPASEPEAIRCRQASVHEWVLSLGLQFRTAYGNPSPLLGDTPASPPDGMPRSGVDPRELQYLKVERVRVAAMAADFWPAAALAINTATAPAQGNKRTAAPIEKDDAWKKKAQELAQQIGETKWTRDGTKGLSTRYLAQLTAVEMANEKYKNYWGSQGSRSESNIRNEALKGWKFSPPDEVA